MGIFDSLKNMTNQAVKNNVSKAVSGAVNNAMHKSKTFVFADYPKNADELKKMPELDFSSPLSTAAFAMLVLLEYDESPENTIEMLNVLKGPQPMNGMDIQFLRDRIKGRGYIPRSYFEGSSVKNDYTPNVPYKIRVLLPYRFTLFSNLKLKIKCTHYTVHGKSIRIFYNICIMIVNKIHTNHYQSQQVFRIQKLLSALSFQC